MGGEFTVHSSQFTVHSCRLAAVSLFIAFLAFSPAAFAAEYEYQKTFFGSGAACGPSAPCKKGEVCNTAASPAVCVSETTSFFGGFGITSTGGGANAENYAPYRFFGNVINALLGLLGIFSVAVIAYGGFQYMSAGGDAEKAKSASKIIFYAALGLVAIALAWVIGYALVNSLIGMLK